MNQPNLPVIAPRPAAAPEGLDLLMAFRRYLWLLICGTIVGGAVGTGLYVYEHTYEPRFTAHIAFEVLPPPIHIGDGENFSSYTTQEDDSSLIHRQAYLFEQESFLEDILKTNEFRTDPGHPETAGTGKSQWLRDNELHAIDALKRDLRVVPRLNAASFELTMTARDPYEAWALVNAAKVVYLNTLETKDSTNKNRVLQSLNKTVTDQKAEYDSQVDSLSTWAQAHNVDVQRSQFEIEKAALQDLDEESIRVHSLSVTADAQLKLINQLIAGAKDLDADGKPKLDPKGREALNPDKLQLTPDMEAALQNDPLIRSLDSERVSWTQERVVEESKISPNPQVIAQILSRLKEVDNQHKDELNKLRIDAAYRMADLAKNDADSKAALSTDVDAQRTAKAEVVRKIGSDLMEYQQRSDQLGQKQQMLFALQKQLEVQNANRGTDDIRVQPLADAFRPTSPSSPNWIYYIPVGAIAGMGLSALLAYLLLLTDTRVRTPRDISRSLQLSLLGFVPDEGDDRTLTGDIETAILSSPASMVAESFRQIRSHVTAQTAHNPVNTLLVASIAPGGGSTTVAANLAASMALNDMRVLLIDANFYRPGVTRIANNIPAQGLADALNDPTLLEGAIVAHPSLPKLHLLGAGSELTGASSELFEGRAFREMVDRLKSRYDMIIFDGAPLNLVSDSLALAARVDGVIPVVRAGEVSRGTVTRVRDQLRNVHANLLGFVLNAVQTNNSGYFKENYRTYFRYAGQGRRAAGVK